MLDHSYHLYIVAERQFADEQQKPEECVPDKTITRIRRIRNNITAAACKVHKRKFEETRRLT